MNRIRGLYGIADATAAKGDPERLAAAFLAGGCRLLQLRCKDWSVDDILPVARSVRARCAAVRATFIVNDHVDIALQVGADGVHLGQLDQDTATARALLGPLRLIGRSTGDPDQIANAIPGADYLAFGPIFATENAGRPKPVRDLDALAVARVIVPLDLPLVAIGGLTAAHLPQLRAMGVDAWAVIGAVAGADDPVAATRALC